MAPKGLHLNAGRQSTIDAMLHCWQNDWRVLDQIPLNVLTPAEQEYLDDVKVSIEAAIARLDTLLKLNAGKPASNWK